MKNSQYVLISNKNNAYIKNNQNVYLNVKLFFKSSSFLNKFLYNQIRGNNRLNASIINNIFHQSVSHIILMTDSS